MVVYNVTSADGGWLIRLAGDSQSELAPSKQEAVRRAQELGKRYPEWAVRVLNPTGALEAEYTSTRHGDH
jgi:hypothetical protein